MDFLNHIRLKSFNWLNLIIKRAEFTFSNEGAENIPVSLRIGLDNKE